MNPKDKKVKKCNEVAEMLKNKEKLEKRYERSVKSGKGVIEI